MYYINYDYWTFILYNIFPIEFIEYANIKLENSIENMQVIISIGFLGTISPYPTVIVVVTAQ